MNENPQTMARIDGAGKVATGLVEGVLGLKVMPLNPKLGTAMVMHGSDVGGTGLNQLWTGEFQSTGTSQTMQALGVPQNIADGIDGTISGVLTGGATKAATMTTTTTRTATTTGTQYTKSSLQQGQLMHRNYKVGADGIKEFRLPSGKRIDFLDVNNRTIFELKPNNPRGIQQGQRQLQMYRQELQTIPEFRGNWNMVLDLY